MGGRRLPAVAAYRLAVDLGSSNTAAALERSGSVRPLLFDGSELLPSAVFAGADGRLASGRDAERLGLAEPGAFEPHPKRRVDDGVLLLGTRHVDVRDALAAVLAQVRSQAGVLPRDSSVVMTYPTGWGAPRQRILTEAAERAGLGEVYTVSEAVAAATYFSTVLGIRTHRPLVVVDIGAGTTDVAVVSCGTRVGVLASAGMDLGGLDIDAALVDHLARQCLLPGIDDPGYDRVPLLREVRAAKESLSRASYTPLRIAGQPAASHLTRAELEAAAEPILTRVGEFTAEVIATAALTTDRLAGVLLVGGGSRIPQAANILHQRLGIPPTTVERPETVVVEGALRVPRTSLTAPAPRTAAAGTSELPAVTPTPGSGRATRRRGWMRPGLLVGVLLCFVLPFATVSCGLPDGYGRADPGGTTTYRGAVLAVGGTPEVTGGHLAPRSRWREDRLAPQPLLIGAMLVTFAALAVAVDRRLRRRDRGRSHAVLAILAGVAAGLLVAGELVVLRLIETRVREGGKVPPDQAAGDFVGTGVGFWLALALLLVVVTVELWTRRLRRTG
jgi:actin-like ATPase involved in cell morphogenesis